MSNVSHSVSIRSTGMINVKRFFLAIVLTLAGAVFIFVLSKVLLFHPDFEDSIYENGVPRALSGLFLLAFPYIHQRLAGKQKLSFANVPEEVVSFGSYNLSWYILLAYGILIAFAIAGMSLFLIWLAGIVAGIFVTRAISFLNLFILFITFYYLGSWIGSRSAGSPYPIAISIVSVYTVLEWLVSVVLNLDSPLRSLFGLVGFLSMSLVFALIGAFIGRRKRLLSYIHFLIEQMPEQERQTLVDNLYSEIKRIMKDKH